MLRDTGSTGLGLSGACAALHMISLLLSGIEEGAHKEEVIDKVRCLYRCGLPLEVIALYISRMIWRDVYNVTLNCKSTVQKSSHAPLFFCRVVQLIIFSVAVFTINFTIHIFYGN